MRPFTSLMRRPASRATFAYRNKAAGARGRVLYVVDACEGESQPSRDGIGDQEHIRRQLEKGIMMLGLCMYVQCAPKGAHACGRKQRVFDSSIGPVRSLTYTWKAG